MLQGVVEIDLINADEDPHMIDIMGRGSILGYNNVIKGEQWVYRAIAKSSHSTILIKISRELIELLGKFEQQLQINKENQMAWHEAYGIP